MLILGQSTATRCGTGWQCDWRQCGNGSPFPTFSKRCNAPDVALMGAPEAGLLRAPGPRGRFAVGGRAPEGRTYEGAGAAATPCGGKSDGCVVRRTCTV